MRMSQLSFTTSFFSFARKKGSPTAKQQVGNIGQIQLLPAQFSENSGMKLNVEFDPSYLEILNCWIPIEN